MVNLEKNQVLLKDGRIVTIKVGKVRHLDAATKEVNEAKELASALTRYLVPHLCTIGKAPLTRLEYEDLYLYDATPIEKKLYELNGFLHQNKPEAKENEVNLPDGRTAIIGYAKPLDKDKATRDAGKDEHKMIRYLIAKLVTIDGVHLIMEDFENMTLDLYFPIQVKFMELNGFL